MVTLTAMRRRTALPALIALTAALVTLIHSASCYKPNSPYYGAGRRIPMSSIRTLTFYSDRRTAYRRTSALPQLTCVGSPCSRYQPDVVQCQAMGDGQWKCSADLPSTMRMGRVEVSCEGYDYADDPYVLKDSCALEYRLLPSGRGPDDPWRTEGRRGWGEKVAEAVFWVVFCGVLGVMLVSFVRAIRGGAAVGGGGGGGRGGWGGGGGGGGWWPGGTYPYNNAPPPPYTAKPEPDSSSSSSSSWRPGFWTGLGLGGLAATAAANSRRRQAHAGGFYAPPQPGFFHDPGFDYGFGGGGGGGRRRTWDDDDRGIGSSTFRESTGFGGTRNR